MIRTKSIEIEIEKILNKNRIGCDLHCHFEGILNLKSLQEVAEEVGGEELFEKKTWTFISKAINSPEKSLQNFSTKLTGRWMRLTCIAAFLKRDIPIEHTMKAFIAKALNKMRSQGIGTLELMVSVFTLSSNGDFNKVPLPFNSCKEEEKLLEEWNNNLKQIDLLDIDRLLSLFKEVIEADKNFCLANSQPKLSHQMEVGVKFMVRREKDHDFKNNSEKMSAFLKTIESNFKANVIIGVDIAGNEYDPDGATGNFSKFLTHLSVLNIPFTIHSGEISEKSSKKSLGYSNLENAIKLGTKRIGHAVRLFDSNPKMINLLSTVIEKKIYIELNLTSNMWTSAIDSFNAEDHPIIKALNGNHPLFEKNLELLEKFRDLVLVCDDDPVVISQNSPSMHQELALFHFSTNKFSNKTLMELINNQNMIAQKAKLWKDLI